MNRFQSIDKSDTSSVDKTEFDIGKVSNKEDGLLFYKIIEKKYVSTMI